MAMMENFQITELLSLVLQNPDKSFFGEIQYLDQITISNDASAQELRSGVGNAVLYSMSSDFKSTLNGEAIMSTDVFKMLTSTNPTLGLQKFTSTETITASGSTVTLGETPVAGGSMFVFSLDENGKRKSQLKIGTPASNATDYSITGKNITIHSTLAGSKIKVIYDYEKSGVSFNKEAKDTSIYRVTALCKAVDLATKEKKIGQFVIPAFKPSTSFEIGASNGDMVKVSLTGECLVDTATGISWSFVAQE